MSTEKMREEFKAWWLHDDQRELRLSCAEGWGMYIWNSSRAAIEVELPEGLTLNEMRYGSKPKPDHQRLLPRTTCIKAIESLGLKVKP